MVPFAWKGQQNDRQKERPNTEYFLLKCGDNNTCAIKVKQILLFYTFHKEILNPQSYQIL